MIQILMIVWLARSEEKQKEDFYNLLIEIGWMKYEGTQMTFFKYTNNGTNKSINAEIISDLKNVLSKKRVFCKVKVHNTGLEWDSTRSN